jgi:iron complex outermembrane recepter protein
MQSFLTRCALVFAVASFGSVNAQSNKDENSIDATTLDAIIVSATREPVADAKTSVSVEKLSGESLRARGVVRAAQLAEESASVTYRAIFGASAPQFFIRGIGNNDINPNANPGIAVYLGESFIASPLAQNLMLFDLESAEILKGPQGTLFGRNATGGALVLNPRKPGLNQSGTATIELDNFGLRANEFALDSGSWGAFTARLAGTARASDGYVRNTLDGSDENDEEANALRLSIGYQSEQTFGASLVADWSRNRAGMRAHQGLGLLDPAGFATPSPNGPTIIPCAPTRVLAGECVNLLGFRYTADPYSEGYDRKDREHVDSKGLSLVFDLGQTVRFRAITSAREATRDVREDTDASPLNIVGLDFINDSKALSQELRWSGEFGPLASRWQAGLFGLTEKLDTLNRYDTLGGLRAQGVPFIADPAQFFRGPFRLDQRYQQRTRSLAAFAESDWNLSERWIATLGLRVTRERNRFATETRFNENITQPILSPLRESANTDSAISWRSALRYQFSKDQSVYFSANRAFKSGYFNGGALFPFDAIGPVAPEFLNAFEAGSKWRFTPIFEAQASAFYYRYNGLQDFTLRPSPPPTRQVLDSADARIKGAEVNVRALLPKGFSMRAAYTYLDARFVDFIDANGVDRSGNRLTASPRNAALAGIDWESAFMGDWQWRAGLQLQTRSRIYFDNSNSELLSSNARSLLHGNLAFSNDRTGTTIRLNGRNLANKKVLLDALNLAEYGFLQQTYDAPRQIGISLSQSF